MPDPDLPFLGAHLTRTYAGEVLLGPSALLTGGLGWPGHLAGDAGGSGAPAPTEIRRAASKRSFVREARRFVPELSASDFVAGPSGVRAQAVGRDGSLVDDFVVHQTERALHVRNAPSPAATSALALARLIADRVDEAAPGSELEAAERGQRLEAVGEVLDRLEAAALGDSDRHVRPDVRDLGVDRDRAGLDPPGQRELIRRDRERELRAQPPDRVVLVGDPCLDRA